MGDQSKGKEGEIFGYSVLDTVKFKNALPQTLGGY
jgi:hypothetical protein